MTIEEKILEKLEQMDERLINVEATQAQMSDRLINVEATQAQMSDRLIKTETTQEHIVLPQLKAIAEGVTAIDSKLITRSEFDSVKEEIAFLKDIIRMHTSQINDLKKAQ